MLPVLVTVILAVFIGLGFLAYHEPDFFLDKLPLYAALRTLTVFMFGVLAGAYYVLTLTVPAAPLEATQPATGWFYNSLLPYGGILLVIYLYSGLLTYLAQHRRRPPRA